MLYDKRHVYLRAPLRVSFLGGGTDFEGFFLNGTDGHVVSTTVNLFVYVTIKDMFDSNVRVHHSEIETQSIASRVTHKYTQTALEHFGLFRGVEVVITSDVMTTGSGLGASSSLMSALALGCMAFRNEALEDKYQLAELIYRLEKGAGTIGGKQDQYATVFGGLNSISFGKDGVEIEPLALKSSLIQELESRLFLVYTNLARDSRTIQTKVVEKLSSDSRNAYLAQILKLSFEFKKEMQKDSPNLSSLGEMLHEGWMMKRKFSNDSTNPYIDELYSHLQSKGVIGGKILGAGGGGFFLAFAKDADTKKRLIYELYPNYISMDFRIYREGAGILWKNF